MIKSESDCTSESMYLSVHCLSLALLLSRSRLLLSLSSGLKLDPSSDFIRERSETAAHYASLAPEMS